jgi:hypothetical protein
MSHVSSVTVSDHPHEASSDAASAPACVGQAPILRTAALPPWLSMSAARRVAALKRIDHLFVEQHGQLLGVLCAAELAAAPDGDRIGAWMKPSIPCAQPSMPVAHALEIIAKRGLGFLAISEGPFVTGIVTREALVTLQSRAEARGRRSGVSAGRELDGRRSWDPTRRRLAA